MTKPQNTHTPIIPREFTHTQQHTRHAKTRPLSRRAISQKANDRRFLGWGWGLRPRPAPPTRLSPRPLPMQPPGPPCPPVRPWSGSLFSPVGFWRAPAPDASRAVSFSNARKSKSFFKKIFISSKVVECGIFRCSSSCPSLRSGCVFCFFGFIAVTVSVHSIAFLSNSCAHNMNLDSFLFAEFGTWIIYLYFILVYWNVV